MIPPLRELELVKERFREQDRSRRELSAQAQLLQKTAKQAIFAIHRDDAPAAQALLQSAHQIKREAVMLCEREPMLSDEGVWRAAQEELLEAEIVVAIITQDDDLRLPVDDPACVIGAISDAIGELARVLVRDVTKGRLDRVSMIQTTAQDLLSFLLEFDATGYVRQKIDQARQHLRKIEDVAYDLAIRGARYV